MKRWILLLGLCLLLTGCHPRSRQPSADFIPTGELPSPTRRSSDSPVNPEELGLPEQADGAVKTVLSQEGVYRGRTEIPYSYQLPYLDLPGGYAMACNHEIEELFGNPIRDSLAAMEQFETPVVQTVSYTADRRGRVLTLRITRTDADGQQQPGETYSRIYSLLADTGEAAACQDFLEAVGMTEEAFAERVTEAAETRFAERTAGLPQTDAAWIAARDQTLSGVADPTALPMYLTEDGKLAVWITIIHPEGYRISEELILP